MILEFKEINIILYKYKNIYCQQRVHYFNLHFL